MPRLTTVTVSLHLPYLGGIQGTWEPDERERLAAWEMYIELVTRVAVQDVRPEGLMGEALTSLYTLFDVTRTILREHGPAVARPRAKNDLSFGYLAITILNAVLRPFLARWHPALMDYESRRPTGVSPVEYEREWDKHDELRHDLDEVQHTLNDYANVLAQVAEVPSLTAPLRQV